MTLLLIMTLLLLFVKSLFVFALSGAALLCLRRASASARHLVCLLTLAALLALPLCSLTLPGWHVAAVSSTDQLPPQEVPPPPIMGEPEQEPEQGARLAAPLRAFPHLLLFLLWLPHYWGRGGILFPGFRFC